MFHGQTPLMFAAGEGNTAAAEMLIEFGADLRARSRAGFTPRCWLCTTIAPRLLSSCCNNGANPNDSVPGTHGGPPTAAINIAVLNGDFDLASLLLDASANPERS
jgi:ankyrin repeat protein